MVNYQKVRKTVITGYLYTFVAFLVMAAVLMILIAVTARFGPWKLIIPLLVTAGGLSLATFVASEVMVNTFTQAYQATPEQFPDFVNAVEEICHKQKMRTPRLRILRVPIPNACAFGMGIFGQYAIGITEPLYELLDKEQLKGVIAHELAHIRCKDVGIMSVIAIVIGGANQLAALLQKGQTRLGHTPVAVAAGLLLLLAAKIIFPVGRNAVAQERERVADALGAWFVGSSQPLINALTKLARQFDAEKQPTFLDSLMITHPGMDARIRALQNLETTER